MKKKNGTLEKARAHISKILKLLQEDGYTNDHPIVKEVEAIWALFCKRALKDGNGK